MPERPESQRDPTEQGDVDPVLQFIEHYALLLSGMGMPRMASRVFTALLATEQESLTAGELAEWLKISPAAVSGAVQFLLQLGMVHKGRRPGSRRDHYSIGDDQWYEAVSMKNNAYERLADGLDEGLNAVPDGSRGHDRITDTREFFTFAAKRLPEMIAEWQHRRRAE